MVGISAGMRSVEDEILQTLRGDSGVLLSGERGVGKTLVARQIHLRSARVDGPFIEAACANIPEDVLESRLFGYEYGRIPPAYGGESWLESANTGTLLLDDVDEIGVRTQETLLRFLESGDQLRVPPGRRPDRRRRPLDVRVIAATHGDLTQAITEKRFLEPLFYRLNVVHIRIPSLRERREDIPILMDHFLRTFAQAHQRAVPEQTPDALAAMMGYRWPGNVRELSALAESIILQGVSKVDLRALPRTVAREGHRAAGTSAANGTRPLYEEIFARIEDGSENFWSAVYAPFMSRDLTRTDVRAVVALAMESGGGTFAALGERLRVQPRDRKRLETFLRKCECEVRLPRLRMASSRFAPAAVRSRRVTA
jgi:DNA-binding NtrC family response regulator